MARPRSLKPTHCHYKASGRAFVTLDGRRIYLGPYGTQDSRDRYDRAIAEWIVRGRPSARSRSASVGGSGGGCTVVELIAAFWTHAQGYYTGRDGAPGSELQHFETARRALKRLDGQPPVADLGPLKLKAIRDEMIRPRHFKHATTARDRMVAAELAAPS